MTLRNGPKVPIANWNEDIWSVNTSSVDWAAVNMGVGSLADLANACTRELVTPVGKLMYINQRRMTDCFI